MLSFFDQRVIESILMFLCQFQVKPYNIGVSVVFPPDTDTPGFENENKGKVRRKLISVHYLNVDWGQPFLCILCELTL